MIETELYFFKPNRLLRELSLLLGFEQDPAMSQHDIAKIAGISSSMAHNYVKQFAQDALITIQGESNRTMRYVVSAAGQERSRQLLTLYTREIVHLYALARTVFEKKLCRLYHQGLHTAVLFGAAETGELLYNASLRTPLRVVGVVDNDVNKHHQKFGELEVLPPDVIEHLQPHGVIISAFGKPDEIYADIKHLESQGIRIIKLE